MKLLAEQRKYLERKIADLQMEFETMTENGKLNQLFPIREREVQQLEIKQKSDELKWYREILTTSSTITSFNNDRIDLGTEFQIKLESDKEIQTFTMVETVIDGYFGPNHGYITKQSPLGKELYQKESNQAFHLQIAGESITGTIIKIFPKENICQEMTEEKSKKEEPIKDNIKKTTDNVACDKYKKYVKKLQAYEKFSEVAKREILHLQTITISQHKELEKYYEEFLKTEKCKEKCSRAFGRNVGFMRRNLAREIITAPNPTYIDLGTNVILEIEVEGKKIVTKLELVPSYYLKESNNAYISVKTAPGFALYKSQIGDRVHFPKKAFCEKRDGVVAQFGINTEKLLIPTSSNVTHYKKQERLESRLRENYQKTHHVMMTESQKCLLDQELSKLADEPQMTPYIKKLLKLKRKVENEPAFVQTQKQVQENGNQIGIGSKVVYAIITEEFIEEKEAEVISCAFTTEEKDQYIEEFTFLGQSLLGHKKNECFKTKIDGEIKKGIILEVNNKKMEKILTK